MSKSRKKKKLDRKREKKKTNWFVDRLCGNKIELSLGEFILYFPDCWRCARWSWSKEQADLNNDNYHPFEEGLSSFCLLLLPERFDIRDKDKDNRINHTLVINDRTVSNHFLIRVDSCLPGSHIVRDTEADGKTTRPAQSQIITIEEKLFHHYFLPADRGPVRCALKNNAREFLKYTPLCIRTDFVNIYDDRV